MGDTERLMKREISFILQFNEEESEFCTRYLFYRNANVFRQNLISSVPFRIDIGAEFNLHLKNREAKIALNAVKREYVIDIDMNDYDGIRTCCSGKKLCNSCWKFMEAAYKVLREVLYEIFGFRKILWVFSGRRGMHAWVCDPEALNLDSMQRKYITNFLNVALNNDKSDRLVIPESLDKFEKVRLFQICEKILLPYEKFLFEEQNFLFHEQKGKNNFRRILSVLQRHYKECGLVYNEEKYLTLMETIQLKCSEDVDKSQKLFNLIEHRYTVDINLHNQNTKEQLDVVELVRRFKFEILVGLLYPKIDSAVSSHTNHLLKAPFNIHSSSLLLSVPVNPEDFDINKIPSIKDIISGRASLVEYIKNFRLFIDNLKRSFPTAKKSQLNEHIKLEKPETKKVNV
jgi:DNA primase small subunit